MRIDDLRKIGESLKKEVPARLGELRKEEGLGKGAGGDTTHPIDKLAEDIVIEEVEKLDIPLTVISEECGTMEIKGGGPRLLMDPIDGSRNAINGVPLFSTSIAIVNGDTIGETSIGYVINLVSGDEYWAVKGEGAFLNGERIWTQQDDELKVINYEARVPETHIPEIMKLLSHFPRARCYGSTALDLAFLAQGAFSMFVVPSYSRSFDFAAGYLLIREAGGVITDIKGNGLEGIGIGVEESSSLLAAGNEVLHQRALGFLGA
jgi:myo-inositol-1(or 4)-monophosphatase